MRIITIATLVAISTTALSQQTDTSYVDLGRTQLKKDFIQTITIKGKDLEKFPFANLTEAINVWLYGYHTNGFTVSFVIDGNMIADVNMYSIHDIEEISLVQNAQVQLNGAVNQQQLVIITTKKNKLKGKGIEINGKTQLVENLASNPINPQEIDSEKNLYHQYHVSAYKKSSRLNAGASFGFLHDVLPQFTSDHYSTRTPDHLERFHLNSYADLSIGRKHLVSARINVARQNMVFEQTMDPGIGPKNYQDRYGEHFHFNAEAKLVSQFSKGLTNQLSAAYAGASRDFSNHYSYTGIPGYNYDGFSEFTTNNVQARNTLRYDKQSGNWKFSPAVNLSFRHIRQIYFQESRITNGTNPTQISTTHGTDMASQLLVTPSFDISLKDYFNLNAGILADISAHKQKTFYPFASATIDILGMANPVSGHSWKLFASYASAGFFYDHAYFMFDLTNSPIPQFSFLTYTHPMNPAVPDSTFYNFQAGTVLSLFRDKFQFSYHFEKRDFNTTLPIQLPNGPFIFVSPEVLSTAHRFQISLKAIESNTTSWFTSIHASHIRSVIEGFPDFTSTGVIGDVYNKERSWTGGWNNRLTVNNFSLGFDLIAHLNPYLNNGFFIYEKNLLSLQHAFIGYMIKQDKFKNAEIFISAKNIYRNEGHSSFKEPRRYYGAGFKLNL